VSGGGASPLRARTRAFHFILLGDELTPGEFANGPPEEAWAISNQSQEQSNRFISSGLQPRSTVAKVPRNNSAPVEPVRMSNFAHKFFKFFNAFRNPPFAAVSSKTMSAFNAENVFSTSGESSRQTKVYL
jgi:hypothetical protein